MVIPSLLVMFQMALLQDECIMFSSCVYPLFVISYIWGKTFMTGKREIELLCTFYKFF